VFDIRSGHLCSRAWSEGLVDAVLKMAQKCPHLDIGGSIEVAQAMQMEM